MSKNGMSYGVYSYELNKSNFGSFKRETSTANGEKRLKKGSMQESTGFSLYGAVKT